jgi:hypothetical protein
MALTNAERFRLMAARIEHNTESTFGGAAVIIPPQVTGQEQPIEVLLLGDGDPAQFIATVVTRLQLLAQQIDDYKRQTFVR